MSDMADAYRRLQAQARFFDAFERVDVHRGVSMAFDVADDERHGSAVFADMERGGARAERIHRHEPGVTHGGGKPGFRIRRPDPAVLDAERTAACARRDFTRIPSPFELERDIATVAFAID